MNKPIDVLYEHPVRKSKAQKSAFCDAVKAYAHELGYSATIEKGSLGVRNLVLGDPKRARYLVTAHYDTCAHLPFPNLITPCSFWLFLGWQILLVFILCLPIGILAGVAAVVLDMPEIAGLIAYFLLIAEIILMLVGPANKHNANDNTSGVVTVLETAAALPEQLRDQVCFVLFDLEEAGLLGSSAYRSAHRKESAKQLVLNVDCVGEGKEILLFPTAKLKKNPERLDRMEALCSSDSERSIAIRRKGFSIYPSDQSNFPLGLGIAAFCRSKWAGLYLAKIHTNKDTHLEENNVALVRDYLVSLIQNQV